VGVNTGVMTIHVPRESLCFCEIENIVYGCVGDMDGDDIDKVDV